MPTATCQRCQPPTGGIATSAPCCATGPRLVPRAAEVVGLEARCENWGTWQRSLTIAIAVSSKEGEYRSPQSRHWLLPVVSAPAQTDVADAQVVEHAVCAMDLYHHMILRAWYVQRVSEPVCLRLAAKTAAEPRGRLRGWPSTLAMAHALLSASLALPAVIRKARARAIVVEMLAGEA